MAFKDDKKVTVEDLDTALQLVMEALGMEEVEDVKSWADHDEAVEDAEESNDTKDKSYDLNTTSLVDKIGLVLHSVTNDILGGKLTIETGEELLAMTQAVALRENLRAALAE